MGLWMEAIVIEIKVDLRYFGSKIERVGNN